MLHLNSKTLGILEIIKSKESNEYEKNLMLMVNSKRTRKINHSGKMSK